MPVNQHGFAEPVAASKWWCADHEHLAADGDMEPPEPKYVLDANFTPMPVGEEAERLRLQDEKRQAAEELLAEEERFKREQCAEEERRRRQFEAERFAEELPTGWRSEP
jgi:hypothetical protein